MAEFGADIVSETPTVSLNEFIDGLRLSDDQEDVVLIMQAIQHNRIKVGCSGLVQCVCLCKLLSERASAGKYVEACFHVARHLSWRDERVGQSGFERSARPKRGC